MILDSCLWCRRQLSQTGLSVPEHLVVGARPPPTSCSNTSHIRHLESLAAASGLKHVAFVHGNGLVFDSIICLPQSLMQGLSRYCVLWHGHPVFPLLPVYPAPLLYNWKLYLEDLLCLGVADWRGAW